MRIFMTGATGYIGGAVAAALRAKGHDVAALVRPDAEAKQLRDLGVVIMAGDLATLPSLGDALDLYDVLIHTAQSRHDTVQLDRNAVDTFLAHKRAHTIYTSGVWVLGNTETADETMPAANPLPLVAWRVAHEELVRGAGGAVLRPGCVYGGKQSLLAEWFVSTEQGKPVSIVGDGKNRWAMVDLHDLADLYVRIAEQRAAGIFHGIDDTHQPLDACARAVAPDGKIEHVSPDLVRPKLGPFTDALIVDQVVSSRRTRDALHWTPNRTFIGSVDEQWREWRSSVRV
ncbi:MAG: NAD-dependent epimerase/dehydratase [Acidobacteria bacterium]|nr:NAD-dependent epimerase/dehydratase [Acidobacteriota bacterium]